MRRWRLVVALAGACTVAVILGVWLVAAPAGPGREAPEPERLAARAGTPADATRVPTGGSRVPSGGFRVPPPPADLAADPGWDPREQPPPSPEEEAYATALVLAEPWLGRWVRDAYARVTGRSLSSPGLLRVRSLIFRRHGCQAHRCLQLFIWLPDRSPIDVGRIVVDLSARNVRTLTW
ncbi:hypothetical protein [Sphaerisporangium corydalis]|uniref:Uncharacterized protein n=1 Tax=Sphaerisporangium corydalis TaxID=1441875 RepID=A0ABV9EFT2_9ACTN|nr:hypothetical protein [Sphaerisporangium corydalis]